MVQDNEISVGSWPVEANKGTTQQTVTLRILAGKGLDGRRERFQEEFGKITADRDLGFALLACRETMAESGVDAPHKLVFGKAPPGSHAVGLRDGRHTERFFVAVPADLVAGFQALLGAFQKQSNSDRALMWELIYDFCHEEGLSRYPCCGKSKEGGAVANIARNAKWKV